MGFFCSKNLSGNPISNTAEIKRENEIDIKEYTSIQDKDFMIPTIKTT